MFDIFYIFYATSGFEPELTGHEAAVLYHLHHIAILIKF